MPFHQVIIDYLSMLFCSQCQKEGTTSVTKKGPEVAALVAHLGDKWLSIPLEEEEEGPPPPEEEPKLLVAFAILHALPSPLFQPRRRI